MSHNRTKFFFNFVRIFPLDYARRYKNLVRTINASNMLEFGRGAVRLVIGLVVES